MSSGTDQYYAEIRIFPFNFAPNGWAMCNGQLMAIAQNTALFSILGTTYGGNGQTTFGLPDLRDRAPMHWGQGPGLSPRGLGDAEGERSVTLIVSEIPMHNHLVACSTDDGSVSTPTSSIPAVPGAERDLFLYNSAATGTLMNTQALSISGGSQPHNNLMRYLTLNFCIALQGVFPPRS